MMKNTRNVLAIATLATITALSENASKPEQAKRVIRFDVMLPIPVRVRQLNFFPPSLADSRLDTSPHITSTEARFHYSGEFVARAPPQPVHHVLV